MRTVLYHTTQQKVLSWHTPQYLVNGKPGYLPAHIVELQVDDDPGEPPAYGQYRGYESIKFSAWNLIAFTREASGASDGTSTKTMTTADVGTDTMQMIEVSGTAITGTAIERGATLIGTISRDVATDTYDNDAVLVGVGIYYTSNQLGTYPV